MAFFIGKAHHIIFDGRAVAYMSLSPTMKLFGTAINYGFGDVEETGILIAVDEILESKRVRHIDSFIKEHPEALKITSGANNVIYKERA